MPAPALSIIIVNYRTVDVLKACLQSLYAQEAVSFEAIVVDNDSGEQERAQLHALSYPWLHIIFNATNLGFGRANNVGVKHAQAPILLILNPDTYLQDKLLLRQYIDAFNAHDYALLVPRLSESEKNKTVLPRIEYPSQAYCRKTDFSGLSGKFAWVLGACMMMKRADYLQIGGFDEDYFMYGEDVDFCWRVRQHLGPIGLDETLTVNHIGSVSEKTTVSLQKWLRKRAGQTLFFQKRYHPEDVRQIMLRHRLSASLKLCKNALLNRLLGVSAQRMEEDARATATLMTSAEVLNKQ